MFDITYEEILERMLDRIPDSMDKREGSVIYDALAPAAAELQIMYIELDNVMNETFADTATRDWLIRRVAERGIIPKPATNAILKGEFTPSTLEIPIGSRFTCGDLTYFVKAMISGGVYQVECETAGTLGNQNFGQLIPIDYISGLETSTLTELLIPAEDEEDTEALRDRYFNSLKSQAFGGNIADYKEKVVAISGVGGCKVFPVENGAGTVGICIIASDWSVPSSTLIDEVQNIIDPEGHSGEGYGLAPIGHTVTVYGCENVVINITADITYAQGWSWDAAKPYIEEAVNNYFTELASSWDRNDALVVRIAQIDARLLNLDCILDIANTKLNGNPSNIQLGSKQIPKKGTINGN